MTWADDQAEAVAVAMNEFGEVIVFDPDGAAISAVGIYRLSTEAADIGGLGVQTPDPMLEVSAESVALAGVTEGTEVLLRGQRLSVVSIERHAEPTVSLQLRGYA